MFGFVFPPWFQRAYPDAMINIRRNSQRLTTPFDINPTLKNVLHYQGSGKGNVKDRAISLFKQVLMLFWEMEGGMNMLVISSRYVMIVDLCSLFLIKWNERNFIHIYSSEKGCD
jgi:hypothetical protein